jgi:tetratricopeptide (TPR) repeat protein
MRNLIVSSVIFITCLRNATAQTPDKARIMDYLQNQQFDETIGYLNPYIAADSANLQVLSWLGYASYMNDNFTDAKKYYQQMVAVDSNNITGNHYLAILYGNTNPVLAQRYALRLIKLQPGKASYYRSMAELLKKTNQKDSALLYYNRAYEIAPSDYKNAVGLSDLLIERKNYSTADSIVDIVLFRDSVNIPGLKTRIRSAYESKDFTSVLLPGERLMRLTEISLSALTQLALAYYNLKMYTDCVRVCDFMLQNDLDIESVYYYQAKAYAKLKDYKKSNELLETCLTKAISKTAEMYYYALGQNYEALNLFTTAVKQYDSAYYLFKGPLMKYYAASVYDSNTRNVKLARKYYIQYLQIAKPASADEKKAYQYVKIKWGGKQKIQK